MIDEVKVFKVKFDPAKSELKDIFAHDIARAVWCFYRDNHMISQNGLIWLNGLCRLLIKYNHKYRVKTARKILTVLISNMNSIEHCMSHEEPEWVEKVLPYMRREKICRVEKA